MKELWRMQYVHARAESLASVKLETFKVIKETEKQYHIEITAGGTIHRLAKGLVDTAPRYLGSGGEWFSTREKAIELWEEVYMKRVEQNTIILSAILDLKTQTIKKGKKKK